MNRKIINYETLLQITKAMSMSRDPEKVILLTVKSIRETLDIKGCCLFLLDRESNEMELVASDGLSHEYLHKGPVSPFKSVSESLETEPVAIYDVSDDPRIQYPEAAKKEGIASILSVPIFVRGEVIGAMRVYTARQWEFTLEDVNFVQALAQMAGMLIDMCRVHKGQEGMIEILTTMRETMPM